MLQMFCPKCGRMNDDELENCKGCGAPLHEDKEEKPEKKKTGAAVKGIIVAAAIAVAAVAVALVSCDASAMQMVMPL